MLVDMLLNLYRYSFDEKGRRGAQGGRRRAKRKGRLVAMKVVNKRGYLQTVYIRPDKNKQGSLRTRSKHINPHDVKFKELVTGYMHSFERMLYKDYYAKRLPNGERVIYHTHERAGEPFKGQDSGVTTKVNRLLKKYGLPMSSEKMKPEVRRKLFEIAAKDKNFDRFINDAKNVYSDLMTLERRNKISDRINKNFSYIERVMKDKKRRGALATTLINIKNGKQAGEYGIFERRDRLAMYNYYKAFNTKTTSGRPLTIGISRAILPVKYNKRTITQLRKNPYYSKYNKLAKQLNGTKKERRQAKIALSKVYIPKTVELRRGSMVYHVINPMYVRIYGKRALKGTRALSHKRKRR